MTSSFQVKQTKKSSCADNYTFDGENIRQNEFICYTVQADHSERLIVICEHDIRNEEFVSQMKSGADIATVKRQGITFGFARDLKAIDPND